MLLQDQLLCISCALMLVPCVLLALDHLITTRMVLGLTIQLHVMLLPYWRFSFLFAFAFGDVVQGCPLLHCM